MKKVLVSQLPEESELLEQFDVFVQKPKNSADIFRHKRIAIAPNGSIVPEVPKNLRNYILQYCTTHSLRFESEFIATLVDQERAYQLYYRAYKKRFQELSERELTVCVERTLKEIYNALNKEFPNKNVLLNTGLEVADPDDLCTLHNYTTDLNDYIQYAEYLRDRNISVGANVLLGAPMIEDPVRKAFITVRFAFEEMRADKILLIVWNPVNFTVAKKLYDKGQIDVMSATEAAMIYQITKRAYPEKEVEYNAMRAHIYHGKHAHFRSKRINTEHRKKLARANVLHIGQEIFGSISL